MIYCLAKNPDKQDKLREELTRILPDKDTPLNGDRMKNMPYLRAVIKETLRLYSPAVMNMRRTAENVVLRGYQVPQGIDIFFGLLHMFHDGKNFEQPADFIPERWLKDQHEDACPHLRKTHPFSYLPFGFGARFCVGKRIAEMELEVFMSRLIRNYKVEWNHPDMVMRFNMIYAPASELRFKMTKL
jgi:cytochrome P450 family 12